MNESKEMESCLVCEEEMEVEEEYDEYVVFKCDGCGLASNRLKSGLRDW
jgi:predicted RNA-binding Zn-ribbon protein involved in translation (DUF1610 family)